MSSDDTEHEWVNVGFMHVKMACKHCDVDQGKEHGYRCHVRIAARKMEEEGAPIPGNEDKSNDETLHYWMSNGSILYVHSSWG